MQPFAIAVHKILGPPVVRLIQAAARADDATPHPTDAPTVHAAGPDPFRVLMVGGLVAAGVGVASHRLALGGHLSRQLAALSGHGTDVDIDGIPFADAARLASAIQNRDLAKYDAVLLIPGGMEASTFRPVSMWHDDLRALITVIRGRVPDLPFAVVGIPYIPHAVSIGPARVLLDRVTDSLNDTTRAILELTPSALFIAPRPLSMSDEPGRVAAYARSAAAMAPAMLTLLSVAPRRRILLANEIGRQRSLDELDVLDTPRDPRFDMLVRTAASLLRASVAAITFVDRDRQWVEAAVGMELDDLPRCSALCDTTISRTGVTLVDDLSLHPELTGHARVMLAKGLRSYAGYPIESRNGDRIGLIFVADATPREFSPADQSLLRSLALEAQVIVQARGIAVAPVR